MIGPKIDMIEFKRAKIYRYKITSLQVCSLPETSIKSFNYCLD